MTSKELSDILNQIEYNREHGEKGLTVEELNAKLDDIIENSSLHS